MDWTDNAIAILRQLWAEGHSTAEIGRRMGCSKNAIIGKAFRLDLPARPNPVVGRTYPAARAKRDTAAAMTREGHKPREIAAALGVHLDTARLFVREAAPRKNGARRHAMPIMRLEPAAPTAPHPALRYGTEGCRWPEGEPKKPGFRFCCAPAKLGKPYCAEHAARAYVSRDEAA